jgi:glycosyltransferase involved in cell wall biosynthesis
MKQHLIVGWKVSTLNPKLASLRYRALLPILALEQRKIESRIFTLAHKANLDELDALVIVKSFCWNDYWLAQEALKRNVPVIFDLCDNVFIEQYKNKESVTPANIFVLIAGLAHAVVVTTEPLAEIVRAKIGNTVPVHVIPDGVETEKLLGAGRQKLRLPQLYEYFYRLCSRILNRFIKLEVLDASTLLGIVKSLTHWGQHQFYVLLARLRNRLYRVKRIFHWRFWVKMIYRQYDGYRHHIISSPRKDPTRSGTQIVTPVVTMPAEASRHNPKHRIVWFGIHGAAHSSFGMLDLLIIREELEQISREFSVELLVISNHRGKFEQYIRPMAIATRYIEWSADAVAEHLVNASLVVIPNNGDPFSICKSANRSVLALSQGVPVVATTTPALEQLRPCIMLDDFEHGMRCYLSDPQLVRQHVQIGKQLISQLYGQKVIGDLWQSLICKVLETPNSQRISQHIELVVAVQLPQDIDLARPILDTAYQRGVQCAVWISLTALQRWPELVQAVSSLGSAWQVFPENLENAGPNLFPGSVKAVLTMTETNLKPHRFTHRLTGLANKAGIYTATMQHGYENVGLSFSDDVHNIRKVRFAAKCIYIWGGLNSLHPDIPRETLKKCIPVGYPKIITAQENIPELWAGDERPVIGIFENLHWHRYNEAYQDFFLAGIRHIIEAFPQINFLIKPHNAGVWFSSRYQGSNPSGENVLLVNPMDPRWQGITAPQLFSRISGVITTPSTVALDAAYACLPIAVVAETLPLEKYSPLPLLKELEDWKAFIEQVTDFSRRQTLLAASAAFVDRVLVTGNATQRIVEDVLTHSGVRGGADA